jgi:UDP-N-acetylglucosamine 2-epimerase (non-hydrolysing)
MKIVTVLGTRPEIIRLSRIIPTIDRFADAHVLVHTGQNHDAALSDVFFAELGVRVPDRYLSVDTSSFGAQAGEILHRCYDVFVEERPDRVLILGDTNSGLAAIVAARLGIPVYHMEAGNRCYDNRVPEEVNRRIIDHSSDVLMPYTERSKDNLVREGIARERIYVTGNPIFEVLTHYASLIDASNVHVAHAVEPGNFILATLHRAENVDEPSRLARLVDGLSRVADQLAKPLIISTHPRTAEKMRRFGVASSSSRVRFVTPLGFADFVKLEKTAYCVLSDSGTVQEECAILGVPSVTVRDVTERAETVECGANVLSGSEPDAMLRAVRLATEQTCDWIPPREYAMASVSATVAKIVVGYAPLRGAH